MLCALLYTTLAPPPPTLSAHLHSLETTTGDALVDSCLRTMHASPAHAAPHTAAGKRRRAARGGGLL